LSVKEYVVVSTERARRASSPKARLSGSAVGRFRRGAASPPTTRRTAPEPASSVSTMRWPLSTKARSFDEAADWICVAACAKVSGSTPVNVTTMSSDSSRRSSSVLPTMGTLGPFCAGLGGSPSTAGMRAGLHESPMRGS
jgi:hypothetical protein